MAFAHATTRIRMCISINFAQLVRFQVWRFWTQLQRSWVEKHQNSTKSRRCVVKGASKETLAMQQQKLPELYTYLFICTQNLLWNNVESTFIDLKYGGSGWNCPKQKMLLVCFILDDGTGNFSHQPLVCIYIYQDTSNRLTLSTLENQKKNAIGLN